MKIDTDQYRVRFGEKLDLNDRPTRYDGDIPKTEAIDELLKIGDEMNELQERLYAEGRRALLVVFQAMDAAGKDSTIRAVFAPLNPEGLVVTSFKAPSATELAHDYLWRVHACAPRKGTVAVFNRSHYEDVLVASVKNLVPPDAIKRRYRHIREFERLLEDEGTRVVKFFLHVSMDYQKSQLQQRLDDPVKLWKFSPGDLPERALWDDYRGAFEKALSECSTNKAPWYVVPAERKWFRNLLVARVLTDTLRSMKPRFPNAGFDPATIIIE